MKERKKERKKKRNKETKKERMKERKRGRKMKKRNREKEEKRRKRKTKRDQATNTQAQHTHGLGLELAGGAHNGNGRTQRVLRRKLLNPLPLVQTRSLFLCALRCLLKLMLWEQKKMLKVKIFFFSPPLFF